MKHLLSVNDLNEKDIYKIFEYAFQFEEVLSRPIPIVPSLKGKTILTLFYEPSTRTQTSFTLACKRLSCDVINFSFSTSSVLKGESLLDTVKNVLKMKIDGIIIRHPVAGVPNFLAHYLDKENIFVINAGDGINEHPTQALLDAYTLYKKFKDFRNLKILIIGDIKHSRVAHSDILIFQKLGCEVYVSCPYSFLPIDFEKTKIPYLSDFRKELGKFDCVITLRVQKERHNLSYLPSIREYHLLYGIKKEDLNKMKKDALLMHPGPVNWGVELSYDVLEDKRCVILDQVFNGVVIRMAIIFLLFQEKV
ncbi:MAG: aspartate carbamoyltransferase catalytic subunit [candidate division WOR-3 bacterium]|nr:aspartate carbamoyltransferase catalytic subunit [candidate division WOR-3 bacterium]MCX7836779.1 aspartate carbamoyltransferase catalytic subunit [candidate division WOR-3 bacterium]MDW8113583.1 aspartate carbamoyltransferase catalytic subunit [candidate division WOR-3 bacterium]